MHRYDDAATVLGHSAKIAAAASAPFGAGRNASADKRGPKQAGTPPGNARNRRNL